MKVTEEFIDEDKMIIFYAKSYLILSTYLINYYPNIWDKFNEERINVFENNKEVQD